jgi:hypothetical protein
MWEREPARLIHNNSIGQRGPTSRKAADAPAHVDEALPAAINKLTKRALVGKAVPDGHLRPQASLEQLDNSVGLEGWPSGLRHRS